jgi:amino-acid N-acetyltransferase
MSLLSRVPRPRPSLCAAHRPPRASFAVRLVFTPLLMLTQAQTIHNLPNPIHDIDDTPPPDNVNPLYSLLCRFGLIHLQDFILSILRANPSLRDTRSYLDSFGPRPATKTSPVPLPSSMPPKTMPLTQNQKQLQDPGPATSNDLGANTIVASILNPIYRHTALVKIQGPFSDVQLDSICRGLVYLEKLGLVSVIVVENDTLHRGEEDERPAIIAETTRIVSHLEKQGARARPVLGPIVRLGPKPEEPSDDIVPPETHTLPSDLASMRSALRAGEIPVIAPFALDSFCRSVRVHANDVIGGLARGMVEAAQLNNFSASSSEDERILSGEIDLAPLRLMIINREGGVPSYARSGYPHLLVNLTSEHSYINGTFQEQWKYTHPTALSNLSLANTCLAYMPPTSSAIMVSHRSPSSLIGNLITNKPAVSSSLPHALLQSNRKLTPHTPTLLRRGLPIQVIRSVSDIDRVRLNALLEQSFRRTLDESSFYARLEKNLDFVIVAGDYAGAAIVTREPCPTLGSPIAYLDKFAVLPSHQGDGTVDFLWVALHDESYGLGHPFSANPNGGKGGIGEGYDLIWRSRADNPVNKWYFERSTGHIRMGPWVMFWCDAEKRLKVEEGRRGSAGLSYVEDWEMGRLSAWSDVVSAVPSSWTK